MKTAFITGITGQDGSYLAQLLISNNYTVIGIIRNNHNTQTKNLDYLNMTRQVTLEECDLLDMSSILKLLTKYKPDEIYNLAAQSSVSLSFKQPISTLQFNISSVLNLLESIRIFNVDIKFYQACSSEMYGKVEQLPITINTPMHPLSPYAISKATTFWTVTNYRESYGLFACSGVLFNHESYLRNESFFVKKVIVEAFKMQKDSTRLLKIGNLNVRRDFGHSKKYIEAMWLMLQQPRPCDYMICSGKSVLLESIVHYVFNKLDVDYDRIVIDPDLYRPTDIQDIYGDNAHAREALNWQYDYDFFEVLDMLIEEEQLNNNN
jgi:GDPmannose 4,6-dehydratase